MYRNVLEHINGIEIYPLVSLIVFFIFFVLILIWVLKSDKKHLEKMANLPLENSNNINTGGQS